MVQPPLVAPKAVIDGPLPTCLGFQQLTSLSTATFLTVPDNATMAIFQAEAADIRYRADLVAPTTAVGMLVSAGREVVYPASQSHLEALQFIRGASGAILNVHYY